MKAKRLLCAIIMLFMVLAAASGCSPEGAGKRSEGLPDPASQGAAPEASDTPAPGTDPAPAEADPERDPGAETHITPEPSAAATPKDDAGSSPAPSPGDITGGGSSPAPGPDNIKESDSSPVPGPKDNDETGPSPSPDPEGAKEDKPSPTPQQPEGDKPLKGKIICLDPGHQSVTKQGSVPIAPGETKMMPDYAIGTRGVSSGVYEYVVVMEVAKKLKPVLEELGAEVVMTKEDIETAISNVERAEIANSVNADAFIRIHCDGSDNSEARGISVLYPGDKYLSDRDMLDRSLSLSKAILECAVDATGAKNRGLVKRDDLIGFNYCKVPCTLIEMGFMTNPEEDILLNSDEYQDKLVKGIAEGICRYFENLGN